MKEPVLLAVEACKGIWNVWRYDTAYTKCILWGVAANSEDDALIKAHIKIKQEKKEG